MPQWIAALLGSGGILIGLVTLITGRAQLRKLQAEGDDKRADYASKIAASSLSLLEPAERRAKALEAQLHATEEKLQEAENRAAGLAREMERLTTRLKLAQTLLTEAGVPFPPVTEE